MAERLPGRVEVAQEPYPTVKVQVIEDGEEKTIKICKGKWLVRTFYYDPLQVFVVKKFPFDKKKEAVEYAEKLETDERG